MGDMGIQLGITTVPVIDQKSFNNATKQYQKMLNATPTVVKIKFDADTKSLKSTFTSVSQLTKQFSSIGGKIQLPGITEAIQAGVEKHKAEVRALENEYVNLKARIQEINSTLQGTARTSALRDVSSQVSDLGKKIKETFGKAELENFETMFGKISKSGIKGMVTNVSKLQTSLTGVNKRVVEIAGNGEKIIRVTQQLGEDGWEIVSVRTTDNVKTLNRQVETLRKNLTALKTNAGETSSIGITAQSLLNQLNGINTQAPQARKQLQGIATDAKTTQQSFTNSTTALEQYKKTIRDITNLEIQYNKESLKGTQADEIMLSTLRTSIGYKQQDAKALEAQIVNQREFADAQAYSETEMRRLNDTLRQQEKAFKKSTSFIENFSGGMKDAAARVANYTIAYRVLWKMVEIAKQAIQTAKELDDAFNSIQMVVMYTNEEMKEMASTYSDLAVQLSTSLTDVAKGADNWLRMGESAANVTELLTASTVLSRVGQIDTADASEYLTSALRGYKLEAEDAMHVVDALSQVDIESASSVADLAEAMQRSANTASVAGVEFEKLIGYIATVKEVTQQSASVIGNAMKTIFSRMGSVKAGVFLDEDLETEYEDIDTFINDVEKVLSKVGIRVRDTNKQFRDAQDIIDDVAKQWKNYSDLEKNAISNIVRQYGNILVELP
jgi:TP901 family phage tail tape measure protein